MLGSPSVGILLTGIILIKFLAGYSILARTLIITNDNMLEERDEGLDIRNSYRHRISYFNKKKRRYSAKLYTMYIMYVFARSVDVYA